MYPVSAGFLIECAYIDTIRKKIKCDLKRPRCSACSESGLSCAYSQTRRKPGPVRGSRRRAQHQLASPLDTDLSGSNENGDMVGLIPGPGPGNSLIFQMISTSEDVPNQFSASDETVLPSSCEPNLQMQSMAPMLSLSATESLDLYCSQLDVGQRHDLAKNFAATIGTAFPLFQPQTFLSQLDEGVICDRLPSIIYVMSARLMGAPIPCGDLDINATLACLVRSATVEAEDVAKPTALNQWRTACLLAWYGFHQHPSKGDAVRIAVLVRKAYQSGLHQIDSEENQASFGWNLVSEETLEDWRHVWWCLYFLDCYGSFSTATPHQVETESLQTALPRAPLLSNDTQTSSEKLFVPSDRARLWKIVQDTTSIKGDKGFYFHMAISTLLKEVVIANRLHKQNPCQSIRERMSVLEDHLSALQLALPPNYMRHTRDLLGGESETGYHSRLFTLLKIYSMRLLLRFPSRISDTAQWQVGWQENLEICYRMFSVIQQWDTQHSLTVDPAVCFIILSLLVLLHLHSLSSGISNPSLREQLARRKNIVRLFLQHYATYWTLPSFLLGCYDALLRKVTERLHPEDINEIVNRFQGPMHQKWLNFLPLTPQENTLTTRESECPGLSASVAEVTPPEQDILTDTFQPWDGFITPQGLQW
ncbi:hypothetical protein F4805DRAFT_418522 [Annulohypoxylon moriforme]|nr:hypothetical protein F4805DRAFT_418522 [Annulohypoxylon moriforme]